MDPITIGFGLLALGTSAFSAIKQQEENQKSKVAADLAIKQLTADNQIQQANNDYGLVAEKLKADAARIKADRTVAELAKNRTQVEKNLLLGLSVFFILAAMIVLLRNQMSTIQSR